MHTHILINEDIGLHIVIFSEDEDLDLVEALDALITERICHATEGV